MCALRVMDLRVGSQPRLSRFALQELAQRLSPPRIPLGPLASLPTHPPLSHPLFRVPSLLDPSHLAPARSLGSLVAWSCPRPVSSLLRLGAHRSAPARRARPPPAGSFPAYTAEPRPAGRHLMPSSIAVPSSTVLLQGRIQSPRGAGPGGRSWYIGLAARSGNTWTKKKVPWHQ